MVKTHRVTRIGLMGTLLVGLLAGVIFAAGTITPGAEPVPAVPTTQAQTPALPFPLAVRGQIDQTLDTLVKEEDYDKAGQSLHNLFDQVLAYNDRDKLLYRDAAHAMLLVDQLKKVDKTRRAAMLVFLRENPALSREVTFAIEAGGDSPAAVYNVLATLQADRAKQLETYAGLATAIAVVHDTGPVTRQINENGVKSAVPLALFDYFIAHERQLTLGVRDIPVDLLIYVVDSTASIEEMEWAFGKFRGNSSVGKTFFTIRYDYDHFRTGSPKAVTKAGYSLQNIARYGGVCADQAYFACSVGKAIGTPTAYTVAQSAEVGHAWVGYFQVRGRRGGWNFDEGRYEDYQGIRGLVINPQTNRRIPDSYVSLLAELVGTSADDRQAAAALTLGAARLAELAKAKASLDAPAPGNFTLALRTPRTADVPTSLAMLQEGLQLSAGYTPAWMLLRDMVKDDQLTYAQKGAWANVIQRLCIPDYMDFGLAILTPMIAGVADPHDQLRMWDAAFTLFQRRPDLAGEVLLSKARFLEEHQEPMAAGQVYMEIIKRYANDGPFILSALHGAEDLLVKDGDKAKVAQLYEQTWSRIKPPRGNMAGAFATQSNWYRVGKVYAVKLALAGEPDKAMKVNEELQRRLFGK